MAGFGIKADLSTVWEISETSSEIWEENVFVAGETSKEEETSVFPFTLRLISYLSSRNHWDLIYDILFSLVLCYCLFPEEFVIAQ